MKSTATIAALSFITLFSTAAGAATFDHKSLLGIWKLEKKTLAASAEMYISLMDAGACTQTIKLKALGTTHWGVARCTWTAEQDELTMKIVNSPTQPDKVGESAKSKITAVTPTSLVTVNQKKEEQNWSRASAMPAEFIAEFDRAYGSAQGPSK